MTTAKEHFDYSTERAMKYIEVGDAQNAFSSFIQDMNSHEGTKNRIPPEIAVIGMFEILNGPQAVERWIKGFPSP